MKRRLMIAVVAVVAVAALATGDVWASNNVSTTLSSSDALNHLVKKDETPVTVRAAAILTTSYVAGTVVDIDCAGQVEIYITYTAGSSTSMEFKVETSPDGVTYYQEISESVSSGVATVSPKSYTIAAASAGTLMSRLPVNAKNLRVSVKGTGTMTSSSCAVVVTRGYGN